MGRRMGGQRSRFPDPPGFATRAPQPDPRLREAVAARGIPHVQFHALRHTGATLLLLQGVNPKVSQEQLGHTQISVALDIYSHVVPSMGRDAADRLDALLT